MKIAFNPSTVAALTTPPNNKDITFDLRGRNIFARGVKFYGTDTNTWRDIKINNVSIGSHALDLRNGSNTTLTNTNGVVTINSTWRPVVDNLTSDSTTSSLSAKQGKVLKALIDGKSNSDHNHDGRYVRYYAVTTLDCNNLAAGLTSARISATNAAHTNHSAYLYISDVGTPFQIQIPDSSIPYIYKRYYGSGKWSGWFKLNAGYADSAGSVAWANVTGKPSSYTPSAHTHAWNSLTHSSTTENQAILTNGKANGWKLQTLNIARWDNAANNAHSHANKSVLDGITSALVNSWNTAYNFVSNITGTDTDKVINKWEEIVNFLAGITEDNKLNTLLNSKLSVYELADNTNVGTIKNNGIYYSTTDASSRTLINSPFNTGFAFINMTSYDGGDDLRRSRLAFNAFGEIKVSDDRDQANTAETWYNVLTSKNSGINGSTIKLNGTSITVYSSGTADGRYVKKSGDTMSGVLTIDTTNFGALTIKRNDDANGASIQFRGKSSVYGYIGLNNSTKDKQFLRWSSDISRIYTILDTSSTYISNGKGVINGTTITQVDNATNSTNSTNARKLVNWYSARPTSLNAQFGDGSLRIFYATSSTTEGKPAEDSHILHLAWDNTGGFDAQLAVHARSGKVSTRAQNGGTWQPWKTLAFTTDIPSSLKNPYSFNVFGVVYDGSAAKTVTTSTFVSQLPEGTSTVTDGTMFITSWASNSGFADTNAVNVPYKRKAIHLWEYIKAKTDSLYATKGHTHDGRYLRLSGQDTMQGNLYLHSHGTSYIGKGLGDKSGADFTEANIVIRSWWGISFKSYDDIVRTYIDTRTGNIGTKGVLNAVGAVIQGRVYNGGDDEGIIINPAPNGYAGLILGTHNGERSVFYLKKGNPFWRYNNGSTNLDIYHPKKSGTIALTSDIPNKDSWNYDDRYLRLTGGWMSGDINFGGDNKIHWGRNTDSASISFKNDGDGDANSYMSFVTSDNGNEYFRWSHSSGSTNTEWMALRSDGLRVRGTKVSLEGHTHDDRYYTKAESNAKYITDITTSVNKLTFTRNGSNIIRDITVNVVHSQGRLTNIPNKDATTKASPGLLIYDSYEQTIGTNSYSSVLSINTGGTIQIAGDWGDDHARNLYWRSQSDRNVADYPWKSWRTILDSENYSSTLDSRYYTESEVNSLLDAKLNRQNLSYGTWNPRGYHLAADYHYNGGDLSISESGGKIHVSVDGYFWQNEGQYRVLDTSDIGDIQGSVTLHQYLGATDAAWYPLVWGGASHNNTSDSTGPIYKSYDKLCWQTSSQTLYATNIQTNNIKNLSIGGGIYWNPNVESASDGSDAASITLVRSGVAGGTTLVLSQMNDTNDTIQFKTNTAARLYHNSYPILTTQNTYVSNNKGYINGTEITQVNNSDKVDNRHAISTTPNTGIIYKAAIYTSYSLTSYWVRLASIPSIGQNSEFVATIHVQSGHSNPGRSAILLVYLRGNASSFMSKSFKICCNSNYDPNRFRLYYKDSDKTSEIWYQTTGQWDGIITTVISQSAEGQLYEGLTLYSGSITAVQTPSVSTYLSAQVSTITDNISGNASTATKLQTPRTIWGQSFDGTGNVSGSLSEVGNIHFKVDNSYDIGSNAAASRYIYTHWLGARSGRKLELGANNSAFGHGLCIDTNLNVGIGTNTPAYKLDVAGDIYTTTGFKKNGSSDSYVLLGGGGHTLLSSLNGSHNHDGRYVRAFGTSNDNINSDWGQSFKTFDPIPSGTPPEQNPNISILNIGENFNRRKQLAFIWNNDNIYYRRHTDSGFTNWRRLAFANEIPTSVLTWKSQVIDMRSYSESYWHPVTVHLPGGGYNKIKVSVQLNSGDKPSWATHNNGITCNMEIWATADGWGTTDSDTICLNYTYKFCSQNPCGWMQLGYPSLGVVFLRGGSRYTVYTDFDATFTPHNQKYTWSDNGFSQDTGGPYTSCPGLNFNMGTIHADLIATRVQARRVCAGHDPGIDNSISCSNWFRSSGNTGWYNTTYQGGWYMSDTSWIRAHNGVGIYTSGQIYSSSSIRMSNILLEHTDEINNSANGGIHLNYRNSGNVSLCYGGGNVGIGTTTPSYKLDVNGQMRASGFHHSSVNSDNYILLAGGGYKSFGGDDSTPIFLGYLNLYNGNDGTISSSFPCLGYSVPFTYTRGGAYCLINIPNTSFQTFYIKAAIASVHYSGAGMGHWVGNHRGDGAWWLHCDAVGSNAVQVKGFHLANENNDSWWGGNPLYSGDGAAKIITVCLFGHVKYK